MLLNFPITSYKQGAYSGLLPRHALLNPLLPIFSRSIQASLGIGEFLHPLATSFSQPNFKRIGTVDYQIEPIAIEQPLDLTVPESKTILGVYLSMPEVENDRRALNVTYGMRRAKKEGRWMGRPPTGYKNKVTENGKKYIAIDEPQASHMRWAFEQIAEGALAIDHVWMKSKERGLRCSRTTFGSTSPILDILVKYQFQNLKMNKPILRTVNMHP